MSEYKVGDVVQIRDWEDMLGEFGYDALRGHSAIATPHYVFLENMRYLCGQCMTIKNIDHGGEEDSFRSVENIEGRRENGFEGFEDGGWIITNHMVKWPEDQSPDVDIDSVAWQAMMEVVMS